MYIGIGNEPPKFILGLGDLSAEYSVTPRYIKAFHCRKLENRDNKMERYKHTERMSTNVAKKLDSFLGLSIVF